MAGGSSLMSVLGKCPLVELSVLVKVLKAFILFQKFSVGSY